MLAGEARHIASVRADFLGSHPEAGVRRMMKKTNKRWPSGRIPGRLLDSAWNPARHPASGIRPASNTTSETTCP
jgi:hypothetical protein